VNGTKVFNSSAQGILAKLLATENITVHVGDYKTAFFDTKNRILGLPSWNVESKNLSDLLVGHEVGHALWTDQAHVERIQKEVPHIPFSIFNIVEDIRIERMIQNRYPGLISSFANGYDELHARDFFSLSGQDVNKLGFADRLNLKGKLGHRIDVQMSARELAIFKRCTEAETFDDVYAIVLDIYKMVKTEKKPKAPSIPKDLQKLLDDQMPSGHGEQTESQAGDENSDSDETEAPKKAKKEPKKSEKSKESKEETDSAGDGKEGPSEKESDSKGKAKDEDADSEEPSSSASDESSDDKPADPTDDSDDIPDMIPGGDGHGDHETQRMEEESYGKPEEELESKTLDSLHDNLADLQHSYGLVTPLLMPSKEQMDAAVTPWRDVFNGRMSNPSYNRLFAANPEVLADWISYKKRTKKQIQTLINEFERRKAAFQYSRAMVSDSGEIDVNRLHSYKFSDEIFRSVTKLADAKSHGMIFMIDYSGSMRLDIFNVLDQTLNIVMFCQAVGIPYKVFGFTNFSITGYGGPSVKHPNDYAHRKPLRQYDFLKHQMSQTKGNVFELLSSDMQKNEQELGMRHMRAAIYWHEKDDWHSIPFCSPWEKMGSTPLHEALVILHRIVEKFRAVHHVQKMTVMILTDGEPDALERGEDSSEDKFLKKPAGSIWATGAKYSSVLYGRQLSLTSSSLANYAELIQNLKEAMNCTLVGFYISRRKNYLKKSGINSVIYSNKYPKTKSWTDATLVLDKDARAYSKNKCMFINHGFNYDCYFLVDSHYAGILDDEEFESNIDDDEFVSDKPIKASVQNKLAREFTKFNSDKRTSRLVLAKFAEMVS